MLCKDNITTVRANPTALSHRSGWKILRCEKSFCKFFRKVFRSFCEVFERFRKFFEVFASFSRLSDPFGPIGMHSDAFGSNWKRLDVFENFEFFGFLSRFSTFPDVIFTKDFLHGTISNRPIDRSTFKKGLMSTNFWLPKQIWCQKFIGRQQTSFLTSKTLTSTIFLMSAKNGREKNNILRQNMF